jgi:hypothetical protein
MTDKSKGKWSKEIHTRFVSILLTNYLRLGFSIKKSPLHGWFHINLLSCQIQFYK